MTQVPYTEWLAKCKEHNLDPHEAAKLIHLSAKHWEKTGYLLRAYLPALDGVMLSGRIPELERAIRNNADKLAKRTLDRDSLRVANEGLLAEVAHLKGEIASLNAHQISNAESVGNLHGSLWVENETLKGEVALLKEAIKEGAETVGVVDSDIRRECERLQAQVEALLKSTGWEDSVGKMEAEVERWRDKAVEWKARYDELVERRESAMTGARERVYTLKITNCVPTILKKEQPGRSQSRP